MGPVRNFWQETTVGLKEWSSFLSLFLFLSTSFLFLFLSFIFSLQFIFEDHFGDYKDYITELLREARCHIKRLFMITVELKKHISYKLSLKSFSPDRIKIQLTLQIKDSHLKNRFSWHRTALCAYMEITEKSFLQNSSQPSCADGFVQLLLMFNYFKMLYGLIPSIGNFFPDRVLRINSCPKQDNHQYQSCTALEKIFLYTQIQE